MDKHNNIKMKKINKRNKKKAAIKIKAIDNQNIKMKQLFIHLLYKEYKKYDIKICDDETDDRYFTIKIFNSKTNESYIMPIPKDITWKILKTIINKRFLKKSNGQEQLIDDDCQICFNKIKHASYCATCTNVYCTDCFIKMFRENQGVKICPFCRETDGQVLPDYMVEHNITIIKKNAGYEN